LNAPSTRRAAIAVYAVAVLASVVALTQLSQHFVLHLVLFATGVAWIRASERLGRWLSSMPVRRSAAVFFGAGLLQAAVVGENLAILFVGDLAPNLLVNTLLWTGCYAGWLAGWWWVGRRWHWTPGRIWMIAGLAGALVEQRALLPRLVVEGRLLQALIALPDIHAVYGALTASAASMLPHLRVADAPPARWTAALAGIVVPIAGFAAGIAWIVALRAIGIG
jgi:hypothetical protein